MTLVEVNLGSFGISCKNFAEVNVSIVISTSVIKQDLRVQGPLIFRQRGLKCSVHFFLLTSDIGKLSYAQNDLFEPPRISTGVHRSVDGHTIRNMSVPKCNSVAKLSIFPYSKEIFLLAATLEVEHLTMLVSS